MAALPAPGTGSSVVWTGGAGDGLWANPANWSGGKVPNMALGAVVSSGATITITDADSTDWLQVNGTDPVILTGGSLNTPAVLSQGSSPLQIGCRLAPTGALTVNGAIQVISGGSIAVTNGAWKQTGNLTLSKDASILFARSASATLSMTGNLLNQGSIALNGGTLNITGNLVNSGTVSIANGGIITPTGLFTAGTFNFTNGQLNCSAPWNVTGDTTIALAPGTTNRMYVGATTNVTWSGAVNITGYVVGDTANRIVIGNNKTCATTAQIGAIGYPTDSGSNPAYLNSYGWVLPDGAITITSQPSSVTTNAASQVAFNVGYFSKYPVSFQWQKNGQNISGATGPSYTIPAASTADAGTYNVLLKSSTTTTDSSRPAALSVRTTTIAQQPADQVTAYGAPMSLAVAVTNANPPISYQWYCNGQAISGANSSTFSKAAARTADGGDYTVAVTSSSGNVVSSPAHVTIGPVITQQPTAASVQYGQAITLAVVADGSGPLAYQWLQGGQQIDGATSPTLTIASATETSVGDYTVVVSNPAGSVSSAAATVTVNLNESPTVQLGNPLNGSSLPAGQVDIAASATDKEAEAITQMVIYLDGQPVKTNTGATISARLNVAPGAHTVYATATDAHGTGSSSTSNFATTNSPAQPLWAFNSAGAKTATVSGGNFQVYIAGITNWDPNVPITNMFVTAAGSSGTAIVTNIANPAANPGGLPLNLGDWTAQSVSLTATITDQNGCSITTPSIQLQLNNYPPEYANGTWFYLSAAPPGGNTEWLDEHPHSTNYNIDENVNIEVWWLNNVNQDPTHRTFIYDGLTVNYYLDDEPTTQYQAINHGMLYGWGDYWYQTAAAAPLAVGTHTVYAILRDDMGGWTKTKTFTITVSPDQAPNTTTLSLSGAQNGTYTYAQNVKLAYGNVTDPDAGDAVVQLDFHQVTGQGDSIVLSLTNPASAGTISILSAPLTAGTYQFYVVATDKHGMSSRSATVSATALANQAPTVALIAPANNSSIYAGITTNIIIRATDEEYATVSVTINGAAFASANPVNGTTNIAWTPAAPGTYQIGVSATDRFGVSTNWAASVVVLSNQAPTVTLTPGNYAIVTPGNVALTASATDPEGESIVSTAIYINGTLVANASGARTTLTTNLSTGTYTVAATATDLNGTGGVTNTINVQAGARTVLLLNMEGQPGDTNFIDSAIGAAVVAHATTVTASPVAQGSGAASFNGTNAYLSIPSSSDYDIGTNDFTIEAWAYPTTNLSTGDVLSRSTTSSYGPFRLKPSSGTWSFLATHADNQWDINASMGPVTTNAWQHLAVSRRGNTFYLFVNGVLQQTITTNITLWANGADINVGRINNGTPYYFQGFIDDVRITKGTALYTTSFTPPAQALMTSPAPLLTLQTPNSAITAPVPTNLTLTASAYSSTAGTWVDHVEFWDGNTLLGNGVNWSGTLYTLNWTALAGTHSITAKAFDNLGNISQTASVSVNITASQTVLLMHFEGANGSRNFVDDSSYTHVFGLSPSGSAILSTDQSAEGTSSLKISGGYDGITTSGGSEFYLTNDFTIEAWIYPTNLSGWQWIVCKGGIPGSSYAPYGLVLSGNTVDFPMYDQAQNTTTHGFDGKGGTVTAKQWQHVAYTRQGTTYRGFLNGVMVWTTNSAYSPYPESGALALGYNNGTGNGAQSFQGYIDGMRIAKGVALYTANFIPSTNITTVPAPVLAMLSPANNATIIAPSNITVSASAYSMAAGVGIDHVEFWDGATLIGSATSPTSGNTYAANWLVMPGTHNITAKAYDNNGNVSQSGAISVTSVLSSPVVTISSPSNGAYFEDGSTVTVTATSTVTGSSDRITNMSIYCDGYRLANVNGSSASATWKAYAGSQTIAVVAYNSFGIAATNAVTISSDVRTSLLDEWKFDGNYNDSVGPRPFSVGGGTPSFVTGFQGQAVSLNGSSYIKTANAIYFAQNSFTVSAWVNSTSSKAGQDRIVGGDLDGASCWWLNWNGGNPNLECKDSSGLAWGTGAGLSGTNLICDGKWHLVTAVLDRSAGQTRIYVDGVLKATKSGLSSSGSVGTYAVNGTCVGGQYGYAGVFLTGQVDNVRVYQARALSDSEVMRLYQEFVPTADQAPVVTFTQYNNFTVVTNCGRDGTVLSVKASSLRHTVSSVQFYLDGTLLGTADTTAVPGQYVYNLTSVLPGNHQVSAVTLDNVGQAATNMLALTVGDYYQANTAVMANLQNGPVWSYWSCPAASTTPGSSKTALNWVYESGWGSSGMWIYAASTANAWPGINAGNTMSVQPGTSDGLLAFKAPTSGSINWSGSLQVDVSSVSAATLQSYGVDGVRVRLWQNGTLLQDWISIGTNATVPFGIDTKVSAGDMLYMQVNAGANGNYDWFYSSNIVTYTSGGPNNLPAAAILSPVQNSTWQTGSTITLKASASSYGTGNSISRVDWMVNGSVVGSATSAPYSFNWTVTTGSNSISAVAYDSMGATNQSAPITVNGSATTPGVVLLGTEKTKMALNWRNSAMPKSYNVVGNNMYGNQGYTFFATDTEPTSTAAAGATVSPSSVMTYVGPAQVKSITSLPSVATFTPLANNAVWYSAGYVDIQDPNDITKERRMGLFYSNGYTENQWVEVFAITMNQTPTGPVYVGVWLSSNDYDRPNTLLVSNATFTASTAVAANGNNLFVFQLNNVVAGQRISIQEQAHKRPDNAIQVSLSGITLDIGATVTAQSLRAAVDSGAHASVSSATSSADALTPAATSAEAATPGTNEALSVASQTYNGLFYETNGPIWEHAGALTLTLDGTTNYAGTLSIKGRSYALEGTLDGTGARTTIVRTNDSSLSLNFTVGAGYLNGTVSDGTWAATLEGESVATGTNGSENYTLLLNGSATGTLSISNNISVFSASLPDGSLVNQSCGISATGQWPLYQSLYSGTGGILGWMQLTPTNITGTALWWNGATNTLQISLPGSNGDAAQ